MVVNRVGRTSRTTWVALLVVIGVLVIPVGVAATVINTDRYVLALGQTQREDVYIASGSALVDGTIEGDLVIVTGDLQVSGTVDGDVLVLARGRVTISGTVTGSVRGAARSVVVSGTVGDELAMTSLSLTVPGTVGRDLLALAGTVDLTGEVGRDMLGRGYDVTVSGGVGRDLHMSVRDLTLRSGASFGGDAIYKSRRMATVADDVVVQGQMIQLPARANFFVSVMLRLAFLLGFFGYVVGGIAVIWLFRRTASGAITSTTAEPLRVLGIGAATIVGVPLLVGALAFTLVGIPLAIGLLVLMLAALIFGTVPTVAAIGSRLTGGRGGTYGGFVAGAAVWWVAMSILPLLGAMIFIVALIWGVGAWVAAALRVRSGVGAPDPG